MTEILRAHAEQEYAEELFELERAETRPKPANWRLVALVGGHLSVRRHAG